MDNFDWKVRVRYDIQQAKFIDGQIVDINTIHWTEPANAMDFYSFNPPADHYITGIYKIMTMLIRSDLIGCYHCHIVYNFSFSHSANFQK